MPSIKRMKHGAISSVIRQPKRELPVGIRRAWRHARTAKRLLTARGGTKKKLGILLVRAGRRLGG
jgi:hypothetical protein